MSYGDPKPFTTKYWAHPWKTADLLKIGAVLHEDISLLSLPLPLPNFPATYVKPHLP